MSSDSDNTEEISTLLEQRAKIDAKLVALEVPITDYERERIQIARFRVLILQLVIDNDRALSFYEITKLAYGPMASLVVRKRINRALSQLCDDGQVAEISVPFPRSIGKTGITRMDYEQLWTTPEDARRLRAEGRVL